MSDLEVARIAVWSGPRNISTALMRSWGSRDDTIVHDEPFYAHYLAETGKLHPGRDATLAAHDTDWQRVADVLLGPLPEGKRISYQKHMAHHLLPGIDRDWMRQLTMCFLIRNPRDMLSSLCRHIPDMTNQDTGLPQQLELFEWTCRENGRAPCVIDAEDVLAAPQAMLQRWCATMGVSFDPRMLTWSTGPRDTDGAWGPYWYQEVYRTTTFGPVRQRSRELARRYWPILDELQPMYDRLHQSRLTTTP